eukprot:954223_1
MSADFDRGFASDVSIISISSVSSVPEHLEVSSASSVESSDLEDLPPGEEKDAMDAEIQRRLRKAFDADSSSDEENDTNGKDFEISNGLFDEISESSIDKCPRAEDLSRDESDTSVPETSPIAIPPLEHVSFVNEKIKTEHIHPTTSSIPNRISSLPSISSRPMDCKAETDTIFSDVGSIRSPTVSEGLPNSECQTENPISSSEFPKQACDVSPSNVKESDLSQIANSCPVQSNMPLLS